MFVMTNRQLLTGLLVMAVLTTMISQNAFANTPSPSGLVATPISTTQINLSWSAGGGTGPHTQDILRCTGVACTPTVVLASTTGGATAYSDLTVVASTTYGYAIKGIHGVTTTTTATSYATTPTPDVIPPVVTGSTTNIVDGGNTFQTLTDQYTEFCTATDTNPLSPVCTVQSGGIDTSVLGLQTVTYEATDTALNVGTDIVSTTVIPILDVIPPVVTGSTTNIVDGGNTELTLTDQYTESCTATDETSPASPTCSVQSGSIDTSVVGLQSVTYEATDTALNVGTDIVSTTVEDTTNPILSMDQTDPQNIIIGNSIPSLTATVSDNNVIDDGFVVDCDESAVDNLTVGSYSATCDFTDTEGNSATTMTYTVNIVIAIGDAPIITINGDNPTTVTINDVYVDAGATSTDTEDGTTVVTDDSVLIDTSVLGTQFVTYSTTDSDGNMVTAQRTVDIVDVILSNNGGGSSDSKWKTKPTFGKSYQTSVQIVTDGFGYDGYVKTITDNYHTPFDLYAMSTGDTHSFSAKGYFSNGIMMQVFCFGVPSVGQASDAESCVEVHYDYSSNIVSTNVVQDTDVITLISAGHSKIACGAGNTMCDSTDISVIFNEPLKSKVIMIQGIDLKRRSTDTYLNEGFDVNGKQFTELPSVLIPLPEKFVENKCKFCETDSPRGLLKVTQSAKYSDIWVSSSGRQFERNDSGSFTEINKSVIRLQDTGSIMERNHSAFAGWKQEQTNNAKSIFDSSKIQGNDGGFKTITDTGIDHREQTLQKLVWYKTS